MGHLHATGDRGEVYQVQEGEKVKRCGCGGVVVWSQGRGEWCQKCQQTAAAATSPDNPHA